MHVSSWSPDRNHRHASLQLDIGRLSRSLSALSNYCHVRCTCWVESNKADYRIVNIDSSFDDMTVSSLVWWLYTFAQG